MGELVTCAISSVHHRQLCMIMFLRFSCVVGSSSSYDPLACSMDQQRWSDALLSDTWRRSADLEMPGRESCSRFSPTADDTILCPIPDAGVIHVVSQDTLQVIRTIDVTADIRKPTHTVAIGNALLAVAGANGCFVLDTNTDDVTQLCDGHVSNVASSDGSLYALQHPKFAAYCVLLKFDPDTVKSGSWTKLESHVLTYRSPGVHDSMLIEDGLLYICCHSNACVYQYTLRGQLLTKHGERGHGGVRGELWQPVMCSMDGQHSLLLLEADKQRFQLLDVNQSSWQVVSFGDVALCDGDVSCFERQQQLVFMTLASCGRVMWASYKNGRNLCRLECVRL